MKFCTKCKQEKELDEFRINRNDCKSCEKQYNLENKERRKETTKQWHLENKEYTKEYRKQWYLDNKEHKLELNKQWKINNQEREKEARKQWNLENKEHVNQYQRNKRKTDPEYNLMRNLRSRVGSALKWSGIKKSKRTMELIGCSVEFLKKHLEDQFKPNMSWDNRSSFHIDHIKPCSSFNLLDEEEQKKCFHYSNLQPLTPEENLKKYNKVL